MKKDRMKEGGCGIKTENTWLLEWEQERAEITRFQESNCLYRLRNGCWLACVQNMFDTLRFSKALGGKQNGEQWEWGVSDKKRQKQETERKSDRKRREIWITHGRYDHSVCPSLFQPDHPLGLRRVDVCVCAPDKCVLWSESMRMCMSVHSCVLRELSQQEWKHMGWRAHAEKHTFSHKTVSQQRFFPESISDLSYWRGERPCYLWGSIKNW